MLHQRITITTSWSQRVRDREMTKNFSSIENKTAKLNYSWPCGRPPACFDFLTYGRPPASHHRSWLFVAPLLSNHLLTYWISVAPLLASRRIPPLIYYLLSSILRYYTVFSTLQDPRSIPPYITNILSNQLHHTSHRPTEGVFDHFI